MSRVAWAALMAIRLERCGCHLVVALPCALGKEWDDLALDIGSEVPRVAVRLERLVIDVLLVKNELVRVIAGAAGIELQTARFGASRRDVFGQDGGVAAALAEWQAANSAEGQQSDEGRSLAGVGRAMDPRATAPPAAISLMSSMSSSARLKLQLTL